MNQIKEMAEQAISKETGEYIMTLAEKLRKEGEERGEKRGKLEGLREAIELGITLKFPGDIDTVMVRVNKIDDLDTLKNIKEAIKAGSMKSLHQFMHDKHLDLPQITDDKRLHQPGPSLIYLHELRATAAYH